MTPPTTTTRERRPRPPTHPAVASAMDPRILERRAGVLRSEARRRLRRALAAVLVVALCAGGWAVLHSRLFSARVVTVVGSVHTPEAAVIAAAGLANDPPLLDVNASASAVGVERLSWVAHATVVREWPDGVRVIVVERKPLAVVALLPSARGWAVLDPSGRVLAVDGARPAGLVEVTGAAAPGAPGTSVHGLHAALVVAASLPKAFAGQVADVVESAGADVTLHLTSPLTVYLGSTSELGQKYEDVAAVLANGQLTSGDVIDVSAPAAPVVRP